MKTLFFHDTPLGKLGIAGQQGNITDVYFANDTLPEEFELLETPLIKEAFTQLEAYFAGELKTFSLPLKPQGTDFMRTVWQALRAVPYGTTASYKDIAQTIDKPKAMRAVGLANNKNPIAIFIPCHRIIGSNGKLIGYSGGLPIKEFLLALEQRNA
jgi:methylated-DNA-[protein]-cysteine S-methyltransferase